MHKQMKIFVLFLFHFELTQVFQPQSLQYIGVYVVAHRYIAS